MTTNGTQHIEILISTFNGEKYITEQLESILEQNYKHWTLIIRDDGSTDGTLKILKKYSQQYPDKIYIIENNSANIGINASYSLLISHSKSHYVAFCDQDDLWLPDKLSISISHMKNAELKYGKTKPLLVCSDLFVTDSNLNIITNSLYKISGISPQYVNTNAILCKNIAPGCTQLINRPLALLAGIVPNGAIMYDYWYILVAKYFGKIIHITTPLIYYRQHLNNVLGIARPNKQYLKLLTIHMISYLSGKDTYLHGLLPYVTQAKALCLRFPHAGNRLAEVRAFGDLNRNTNRWKRKWNIIHYRLRAGNLFENIELLLFG